MSSSFWSGEFYFGGVHSDTYKVCIIDFDTSEILKQVGSTFTIELSEENTFNGRKSYIESNRTSENIVLQLAKKSKTSWTEGEIINICRWLFRKNFTKFQTVDYTSGYNLCYYLKAISFKKVLTPDFEGYLEFEFMSYDPYCYAIPTSNVKLNNTSSTSSVSETINNLSNLYQNYKPKVVIKSLGTSTIRVTNTNNNSYIELNGLGNGETVTVDCLMGTVIDSNKVNRFDLLTGYNLIGLVRGNNNITLSGEADVEFICEFPIII